MSIVLPIRRDFLYKKQLPLLAALLVLALPLKLFAQLPVISYSSPQTYTKGTAIASLIPANTGGAVAALGYGATPVSGIGSGLSNPQTMAIDAAGNIFMTDGNAVEEIPAGGNAAVIISSAFSSPYGVALDLAGDIYVADKGNNAIKKIPFAGGSYGTPVAIGSGFSIPRAVAVDKAGDVYVGDTGNAALKEITPNGGIILVNVGNYTINSLAFDAAGNLYASDVHSNRIYKFPAGNGSPVTFGSIYTGPSNICVDAVGDVFVADGNNALFELYPNGTQITLGSSSASVSGAPFNIIQSAVPDASGNLFVADGSAGLKELEPTGGFYISPFLPAGLIFDNTAGAISGTPMVGSAATNYIVTGYNSSGSGSAVVNITVNDPAPPSPPAISYASPQTYTQGTAISALTPANTGGAVAAAAYGTNAYIGIGSGISNPQAMVIDAAGNIYMTDGNAVKKMPAGGGAAITINSTFISPYGLALDAAGNIYVADAGNNAIKEIPLTSGSYGTPVTLGSGFSAPKAVAVDAAGDVYVGDSGNGVLKEILVGGAIVLVNSNSFNINDLAFDGAGNLYASCSNIRAVFKFAAASGPAVEVNTNSLSGPLGLSVDAAGNVFVADGSNALIEIPPSGFQITLGSSSSSVGGAPFNIIQSVVADAVGNLYIADGSTGLKELKPAGGYYAGPLLPAGLSFNNTTGVISGTPAAGSLATNYTITAYNNVGNGSATVNITVNASAPSGLPSISYAGPQTYSKGSAITPLTPANTGGATAVRAYSLNPLTGIGSGISNPQAMVADAAGNIYMTDGNSVKKMPAGGGAAVIINSTFNSPYGLSLDAAGNIYVADAGNNAIKKIPLISGAYGTPVTLGSGFKNPEAVAVDAAGDVYVGDAGDGALKELPAGGGIVIFGAPGDFDINSMAVNASGILYANDVEDGIFTLASGSDGAGVSSGISLDAGQNVFAADGKGGLFEIYTSGTRVKLASSALTVSGAPFNNIQGAVADPSGNLFIADGSSGLKELKPTGGYYISTALPPGLSFDGATGTISGTPTSGSPSANYTITAYNSAGNNSATVNITVIDPNPGPPPISYATPQTYTKGTAITPLTPINPGATVAAPAYGVNPYINIGSGLTKPQGMAIDVLGNIYMTDGNTVKKMPAGGGAAIVIDSTFSKPYGLALDAAGNIYVADVGNNAIKKIPLINGSYGTPVTLGSGFSAPAAVAVDGAGNVYVGDTGNQALKEIQANGSIIQINQKGTLTVYSLALDPAGNLYAFLGAKTLKFPAGGGSSVTFGPSDLPGNSISADGAGRVFLSGGDYALYQIFADGSWTTLAYSYEMELEPPFSLFAVIQCTASDAAGNLYIADGDSSLKALKPTGGFYTSSFLPAGLSFDGTTGIISGKPTTISPATNYPVTAYNSLGSHTAIVNIAVHALVPPSISYAGPQSYKSGAAITTLTPANTGGQVTAPGYSAGSTILGSGFNLPAGITIDAQGNVYVADQGNNAVKKIPNGTGTPITIGTGFNAPKGIAVDVAGNVYVVDEGNNAVKEIPVNGGAIITLGSGFSQPYSAAVDINGNVYVADKGNNAIKEIPAGNGAVITLGFGFTAPTGVAVDAYGNVYVADNGNGAVKEIPAGNGAPLILGSGISSPFNLAIDGTGNLFVADNLANQVKEIPAGNGTPILVAAGFTSLAGVAVDNANNLYVSVDGSSTVKKIQPTGGYYISPALPKGLIFNNITGAVSGTPSAPTPATNYTVISYNQYGSNSTAINIMVISLIDATLSAIGPQYGPMSPPFTPETISYALNLGYQTESMWVKPVATDPAATINVDGVALASGATSAAIPLPFGATTPLNIVVTGKDGVTTKTYTINLTRPPSANAALTSLQLSNVTLNHPFVPSRQGYTATVSNGVASTTATAITIDPNATIKIDGVSVAQGAASGPIALTAGATTTITVVATAQDGTTTFAYSVAVTRATSPIINDATLSGLVPQYGSLTPVFASGTANYALSENNTIQSITVTPVANSAGATIKINGAAVSSGVTSQAIALAEGTTTAINVVVTAADGITTKTYTLTVTRAPSAVANLANLQLSSGALSPAFASGTTSYTALVANAVSSITITPTSTDAHAAINVNAISVNSGTASGPIALTAGSITTINVSVIAQNGSTTKTYTINVTRAPFSNTDATLTSMGPQYGPLTPVFSSNTANYTLSVSGAASSMTVKPVATDAGATIKVNGNTVISGTTSPPIALAEGITTAISVVVTSADGSTTKTYNITVTRGPSSVATLANLVLSSGPLSPAFVSGNTSYVASVINAVSSITITPTSAESHAAIKVNGVSVTSGTPSGAIALTAGGATTINVLVTAQDGITTKTYTINVTRAPPGTTDATLSSMGPQYGPLTPVFVSTTTSYTLSVSGATTSMTVKPVTTNANASIKVNGKTIISGTTSAPIALAVGFNAITTVVTAQDGVTTKTYTITVTRSAGLTNTFDTGISVSKPTETVALNDDGIVVHHGISPNGDGINDFLQIDNINQYPDNKLTIMNRNGQMIYEAQGYDNSSKTFEGHNNKNGQMQLPGTYFYQLDYTVKGVLKHKTGFVVLKY